MAELGINTTSETISGDGSVTVELTSEIDNPIVVTDAAALEAALGAASGGIDNRLSSLEAKHEYQDQRQVLFRAGDKVDGGDERITNPQYRIPSIVATQNGTILAFSDYRLTQADEVLVDTICAISKDGGNTWTKKIAINKPTEFASQANDTSRVMDPTAVVTSTGKVIVLVGQWSQYGTKAAFNSSNQSQTHQWFSGVNVRDTSWTAMLGVSTDGGNTWSQAPIQFKEEAGLPDEVRSFLGGVGAGICINHNGGERVILPIQCNNNGVCSGGFIFSDDDGVTWEWAKGLVSNVSENMVIQLEDGKIVMVGRRESDASRKMNKASYYTEDFGATWSVFEPWDSLLANSVHSVQGTILRCKLPNNKSIYLATNIQNEVGSVRDQITVYALDPRFRKAVPLYVLAYPGAGSGYSTLCFYKGVDGVKLYAAYESGTSGKFSIIYQDISFLLPIAEQAIDSELVDTLNTTNKFNVAHFSARTPLGLLKYGTISKPGYVNSWEDPNAEYTMYLLNSKATVSGSNPVVPSSGVTVDGDWFKVDADKTCYMVTYFKSKDGIVINSGSVSTNFQMLPYNFTLSFGYKITGSHYAANGSGKGTQNVIAGVDVDSDGYHMFMLMKTDANKLAVLKSTGEIVEIDYTLAPDTEYQIDAQVDRIHNKLMIYVNDIFVHTEDLTYSAGYKASSKRGIFIFTRTWNGDYGNGSGNAKTVMFYKDIKVYSGLTTNTLSTNKMLKVGDYDYVGGLSGILTYQEYSTLLKKITEAQSSSGLAGDPVILPSGTQPSTDNIPSGRWALVL